MIAEVILQRACAAAVSMGAEYAEARAEDSRVETLRARDGAVQRLTTDSDCGWGLRVALNGGWGFAATAASGAEAAEALAAEAVAIARASATQRRTALDLRAMPAARGSYETPMAQDPFAVPLGERIDLLLAALAALQGASPRVKVATARLGLWSTDKLFVNTTGAHLRQRVIMSGAWLTARAQADDGYSYRRTYGNMRQAGWEYITALDLVAAGERTRAEVAALVAADWAPSGPTTAVIGSEMMGLLVHESCGHPIELDRVLGWEAAFAGTSFLMPDMLGRFRYGSPHVNLTADALTPGGLGTFGWDDEGTPAQRTPIVRAGIFSGYLSNRETAAALGQASGGTARATSWGRIPIVRMTNVSLDPDPAGGTLADLIAGVDHGLYLETPSSWSLDDKRMNFHFSVEMCREIKGGRLGRLYKAASFQDRTPHFWGSVAGVGGPAGWQLWGLGTCAKGEPLQICPVGHGTPPVLVAGLNVTRGG